MEDIAESLPIEDRDSDLLGQVAWGQKVKSSICVVNINQRLFVVGDLSTVLGDVIVSKGPVANA